VSNPNPAARAMKEPGPEHPISIERNSKRIRVSLGGRLIADSRATLSLRESTYPVVRYIPRSDVDMTLLERSAHTTYCPYKGTASYFSIPTGGRRSENAIWTYETPHPAVASIKEYLAFYPDRVDSIEESDG
jgi:uncharacterized protein (DUF427 family)